MKTTLPNVVVDDSLSAMADGELHGEAFAQTLAACEHDPALLANWHDYHLIGDVLRSADLAVIQGSSRFLTRLQSRLAHEALQPNVPSAVEISAESERPTVMSPSLTNQAAANDPAFRWKIVAGFASMAAVAMMLWTQIATRVLPDPNWRRVRRLRIIRSVSRCWLPRRRALCCAMPG